MGATTIRLKVAFLEAGVTQQEIAAEAEIHSTRLSKIIRGWVTPTQAEKRLIARALRRPVQDLFQEEAVAS